MQNLKEQQKKKILTKVGIPIIPLNLLWFSEIGIAFQVEIADHVRKIIHL